MRIRWLLLLALFLIPLEAQAQGVRVGDNPQVTSSPISGGQLFAVANANISFCSHPANAVPCTNKATTYTDITLGTPCSTSTQIVLAGTSTCVANSDGLGNWGVWVAAGTYDYTIQLPGGGAIGPYTVTLSSGGGGFTAATDLSGTSTSQNVIGLHFGVNAITLANSAQTGCLQISAGVLGGTGNPCITSTSNTPPAGVDTQLQFNKSNTFGASTGLGLDSSTSPTVLNIPFSASIKGPRPWVDVTAYGATGLGVGHDDTAAITAAIAAACAANSATVFFPPAPNFYAVTQVQTGTSATAAIFPIPCSGIHLLGGSSEAESPQLRQGPSTAIVVVVGASPNPGPVFSVIGEVGVTFQNLTIQGFNEAIYIGDANGAGATSNIVLHDVNTSVNGLSGRGTATQPNCAEVYGGGLWYTATGGGAQATGTGNGNAICILNDTGSQPPGIIKMSDRTMVNCIDAKSIGPQTGTAGDWVFYNVVGEDCNNGYFVIDDDGSHPWQNITDINIEGGGTSDDSYSAYFTLNSNVTVQDLRISQTSGLAFGAALIKKLQGSISFGSILGSPAASGNVAIDGSGNTTGSLYMENGFGFDLFSATTQSSETDIQQNSVPTGGFRAFQTGNPAASSFATVNADPYLGYGMGLSTNYGPEVALKSSAAGSFDVTFPGAYAPTNLATSPTTGGSIAAGTYYYFLLTSTSGNCSTGLSVPTTGIPVTLSGANNATTLTWTDPVLSGTGAIQGYCVVRGSSSQGPHWSQNAQYHGGHFVTGSGTTTFTDTGIAECCFQNHIPIGTFSGVHRFTSTSLGVNTLSPGTYNLNVNGTALHQSYIDFTEISTPANPSAGFQRVWADSTHSLLCKISTGASCISGGGGGGPLFQVNGTPLISSTTVNYQNSAATNGLTLGFTNPSAGNVQLTLSGTCTIAMGCTGATTAPAAFNALAPSTFTGGLIVGNGTNQYGNLGIGSNGTVLTSNGSTALWQAPTTISTTGSPLAAQGTFFSAANTVTGSANWTYSAGSGHSIAQGANNTDVIYGNRNTDVASTGNFLHFQNAAKNSDIFKADVNGNLSISQQLQTGTSATTHFLQIPGGTPSGCSATFAAFTADASGNAMLCNNGAAAVYVMFSGADLNSSSQVTSTHLSGPSTNTLVKSVGGNLVNSTLVDNGTNVASGLDIDLVANAETNECVNDTVTGTTNNLLMKPTSTGCIKAGTGDINTQTYIVQRGGATSGFAQYVSGGQGLCTMDANGSNTRGFYVIASTGTAGQCHAQSAAPSVGIWVIGQMIANSTSVGASAAVNVDGYFYVASGAGTGTVTNIATSAPLGGGAITTTGTLTCTTCVTASAPGAGVAHFAGATQAVTSSAVVGADMTNNTVTATQLAAQYSKWICETGIGDGLNAIPAGTYLQFFCINKTGVTVTLTGLLCFTDNAGTSSMNAANNASTGLLTGAVTCNNTKTGGGNSGTQSATTTLASNDAISFTFVADGTSKQATFTVTGTY
jgi:hypothetical protein